MDDSKIDAPAVLRAACSRGNAPTSWDASLAVLEVSDPISLDRMDIAELRRSTGALVEVSRWLRSRVDTRTRDHVRWQRRGRLAALAIASFYGISVTVHSMLALPNVALGKPVQVSSTASQSAPPAALVNGVRSSKSPTGSTNPDFFQSNVDGAPSATIDLGRNYGVREIRVYNRADGYYNESLPYTVELSSDGKLYAALATRTTHFGSGLFDPPWKIDAHNQSARFVRIRATNYLALSEVEVYAK